MQIPPLNALRAFEAVVRTGSFNAAAHSLCVTQSAVSHQVRNLEDWLGVALFDRSAGRPRLLPRGEELARSLGQSFGEIRSACQRAREAAPEHPLVIATIPSIAICWLIPRLSRFRARHPELNLSLIYAMPGLEPDFSTTHFGFVFGNRQPSFPGARAEIFLSGTSAPVCSPALLPALEGETPLAERIRNAGLLHDTDTSAWRAWFARAEGRSSPPASGPVFEDFNMLRAAALAGQGVALCPLSVIRQDLEAGHLIQLSDLTVQENYNYYLLRATSLPPELEQGAQAFHDWALETRTEAV